MLKRYLIVLLSIAAISSAKAESVNPQADNLDTKDVQGVSIGDGPDNLYKVPPKAVGPADLYKEAPRKPDPIDVNPVIVSPQWLFPRIQAKKVTPEYIEPANSIGIIATDGSRGKNLEKNWACTAFCAADDVIATNAHCLANAKGQDLPALDNITFHLRSYIFNSSKSNVLLGPAKSSKLRSVDERNPHLAIYSGYNFRRRTVAAVSNDWAFAKLQHPVCHGLSLSFLSMKDEELIAAGKNKQIFMIAYDKENMNEPNIVTSCKIFSRSNSRKIPWNLRRDLRRNKAVVIHDCDSREGSSGGPIFINKDGVLRVVAINQGYIESVKRTPVKRVWRRNRYRIIYNTTKKRFKSATHPRALIDGFKRFREEKLLNSLDEFKEVQTYLKDLRLYRGKIDGLLGPGTKRALIRYEKRAGLVPIGLPTQHLLTLLRAEFKADETASTDAE